MKILGFLLRMFVISVLTAAVIIACAALFMKFRGNAILEAYLSKMAGTQVRFQGVSMNLDKGALDFKGFSIVNEIDFDKKIFNAEKVTVFLNKEKYEKEQKIVLDEIYIKKGVLNIERLKSGKLVLSSLGKERSPGWGNVAYAAEAQGGGGLYELAKNFRKVTIEDATFNFTDYFISTTPFHASFDKFNFVFTSNQEPLSSTGAIIVKLSLSFRIPNGRYGNGAIALSADMAAYPSRIDMEAQLATKYIDVMLFLPYFSKNTPFTFSDGLFSSGTAFKMHNNVIDSSTTMIFHKLKILLSAAMENAEFLSASANSIGKYLTSASGEVVFDFVIKGPAAKPAFGLGPQVKFAIGMVVIEELSKALSQMQQTQ